MRYSHWGMKELSQLNFCTLTQHIFNIACVCKHFKTTEGIRWMKGAKGGRYWCSDANTVSSGNRAKWNTAAQFRSVFVCVTISPCSIINLICSITHIPIQMLIACRQQMRWRSVIIITDKLEIFIFCRQRLADLTFLLFSWDCPVYDQ